MYFNVKIIVRETCGNVRTFRFAAMSQERLDRYMGYGRWDGGDIRRVTVYSNGELVCSWTPDPATIAA